MSGLCLLLASHLTAQTTLVELQTRLVHQPLYLRGQWSSDKLKFAAAGNLLGTSTTQSFTLSGIEIDSLKLDSKGLKIEGKRVGLVFDKTQAIRTPLKESIKIDVTASTDGNYTPALDSIFFSGLSSYIPQLPAIWQDKSIIAMLDPSRTPSPTAPEPLSDRPRRVGGGVIPPVVLSSGEPKFTTFAKEKLLSGNVLVYLQVDEQGRPQKVRVLRSLGLGLDEMAVDAVSQYIFKPSEENGKPVRIEMNVNVNFKAY